MIDDEATICYALERIVQSAGDESRSAASARAALKVLDEGFEARLIFMDVRLPDTRGLELLQNLREKAPEAAIVVMTAHGGYDIAVEAMQAGALDYLVKPVSPEQVRACLERARNLQPRRLNESPGEDKPRPLLIGRSPAIQDIFKNIGILAASDAPLLLEGESGTGKEMVARALHEASGRKGAFEPVDCASLPAELVESELFGHTRGAFTGATEARTGRIRAADKGTLFLDEIGELPLSSQPKLLRFLAEREVSAVGGGSRVSVDCRVIAATNRDLRAEVAAGRFRADLYFRLSVVTVELPPLRQRREDVIELGRHFLRRFQSLDVEKPWSPEVLEVLEKYDWPGNVRELRNALEHAATFARGAQLQLADLPRNLREGRASELHSEAPSATPTDNLEARGRALTRALLDRALGESKPAYAELCALWERWLIDEALSRCDNSRSGAARLLDMNRATLRKRLDDKDDDS